jgi:hypothetical protein
MPKPTVLPEFATDPTGVTDPTSNEPSITEPTATEKLYGWVPYGLRPPRGIFNWIHQKTYNWLNWIKNNTISGVLPVKMYFNGGPPFLNATSGTTLVDGAIHFDMMWSRSGRNLMMTPVSIGSNQSISGSISTEVSSNPLLIRPQTGNWPTEFYGADFQRTIVLIRHNNQNKFGYFESFLFTSDVYIMKDPDLGDWTGYCGFFPTTVCYVATDI